MSTATLPEVETKIIEALAESPSVADLEAAVRVSLSDLIRVGATMTQPSVGWGQGDTACALSAAALAWEALKKK